MYGSQHHHSRGWKTMIFCNTLASCRWFIPSEGAKISSNIPPSHSANVCVSKLHRAVAYALDSMQIEATSYHGGLHSDKRASNLSAFRDTDNYQVSTPSPFYVEFNNDVFCAYCSTWCALISQRGVWISLVLTMSSCSISRSIRSTICTGAIVLSGIFLPCRNCNNCWDAVLNVV